MERRPEYRWLLLMRLDDPPFSERVHIGEFSLSLSLSLSNYQHFFAR